MVRRAFPAQVTNGQLRFHESLTDLEGRRFMVVLDEFESLESDRLRLIPEPLIDDETDHDENVDFQRPFRRDLVAAVINDGGKLSPCTILPEDHSDE